MALAMASSLLLGQLAGPARAYAAGTPVALGSAGTYSVLAATGVTNTGATSVQGDLGVSPSNSVVGFPPGTIGGALHEQDTAAAQAQTDLQTAYADAANRTPNASFAGDLNGRTFDAGVYNTTAAAALTGTVTLDGQGNPAAVFIFQIGAALNTAASSQVVLINNAQASNVFWQVAGAAGTGASSSFSGTIMAAGAITVGANADIAGRVLSDGTVTLSTNTIEFAEPPVVTITGGATASTLDTTPTIAGTTNAAPGTAVTVTIAGQTLTTTVQNDGSWSATAALMPDGSYAVVASITGPLGNTGTARQKLTVGNTTPVALGSAGTYSVLAATGVTNTGATSVQGDLGVSPSNSVVGFPPGTIGGALHEQDTAAAQAQTDLQTAYADAANRTPTASFAGDLNGRTFDAGVYNTTAAAALTGTVTLDGQGNPAAVFIFQIGAALNTAASSQVVLINNAQASNVFWQVAGAAGTGASSSFSGTIMAAGAITVGANADIAGRVLSDGTVTLSTNTVTTPLPPGTLGFVAAPADVVFPAVTLNGRDQTSLTTWSLDVADNTGSAAGWNVTLTTTAFVGTATAPVDTLAGSGISVTAGTAAACDDGIACTPAISTIAYPLTIPPTGEPVALPIASAAAGSGMGDQTVIADFTVNIPASALADTYTSAWTVAVVSGP